MTGPKVARTNTLTLSALAFVAKSATFILLVQLTVSAQEASMPPVPFTKFVLNNGLTLIVHEDHKAPVVAVNVWYHVGSKNEQPGKTGFAHLFEHLMFNGSEHFDDDYFKPFDRVGATGMNGTTNADRTNYFQVVPTSAIALYLAWSFSWLSESRAKEGNGGKEGRVKEQRI